MTILDHNGNPFEKPACSLCSGGPKVGERYAICMKCLGLPEFAEQDRGDVDDDTIAEFAG